MIRNNVPKPDCETQYIYKMGFFFLRSNPQNEILQSSINISRRRHFYYSILKIAGFYEDKKPHQLVNSIIGVAEIMEQKEFIGEMCYS